MDNMLPANCYTTQELADYASIDDRFKPLLAERIAKEGLPQAPDCDCAEHYVEVGNAEAELTTPTQRDWLEKLTSAIALAEEITDAPHQLAKILDELYDAIEAHETN